jgi:pimeloyl-ACP methyl ester carboxylesterase
LPGKFFHDVRESRSHDEFARLLDAFGDANYDNAGCSIIAHSQGGAAALHLYTYYWSCLDDAGNVRLIQSVGTPYQGTPLAGNIALLGNIFGVGCGYNYDLTYNGAAGWLSGIP